MLRGAFKHHAYRPHSHPGYVIAIVTGGVETVNCRGSLHYSGPGDILLVNPEEIHDGQRGADEGWQYRVFYPRVADMQALVDEGEGRRSAPFYPDTVVHDPALARQLARFHASAETRQPALSVQQTWAELLGAVIARHSLCDKPGRNKPGPVAGREPLRIRRVRELIEARYDQPPSLDRLAREANVSRFHLLRLFKAEMGVSPHAYLIGYRLKKAKALLDRGEHAANAAVDTGFSDQSHFIRHFKAAYGFTPGQYAAARAG